MRDDRWEMRDKFSIQSGYTLVELLISVIVLVVVGSVVVAILTTSFRGSTKATLLNHIRQNGSYAIIQIGRAITYAKSFDGVSVIGDVYTTNCAPTVTPTPTLTQYKYLKITSFDGGQTIFSCSDTIASNSASLLDTSLVALVPGHCYFTCSENSVLDSPIIGVNFWLSNSPSSNVTLAPSVTAAPGFVESTVSVPFSTSITVRNFTR